MIGHCWQTRVVSRQALPNCLARQLFQNATASQGFRKCNHRFERREGELARLEGELARREGELARQVKFVKFEAVNSMMVSLLAPGVSNQLVSSHHMSVTFLTLK